MEPPYKLKCVVFDHTVLLRQSLEQLAQIRDLVYELKRHDILIGAFSTHNQNISKELRERGLPDLELWLTKEMVGGRAKGDPCWFDKACELLNLKRQHFLYVGDDDQDQRTAWAGGVLYLHARWSKPKPDKAKVIAVDYPHQVLIHASHFLMTPPRWQYSLDMPEFSLHVRALMNANISLEATSQPTFRAIEVLKPVDPTEPPIKNVDAHAAQMLVYHALTSAHLEGILERNAYFMLFPSSKSGTKNEILEQYVAASSSLFKVYYRNYLTRHTDAPDTSRERSRANSQFKMNFRIHADTVCLDPTLSRSQRRNLEGRQIVVFDDFMTTGTSLEWARNLFMQAGAGSVLLVSIGKYPGPHLFHRLAPGKFLRPFEPETYSQDTFRVIPTRFRTNDKAVHVLEDSFKAWTSQEPLGLLPEDPFDGERE